MTNPNLIDIMARIVDNAARGRVDPGDLRDVMELQAQTVPPPDVRIVQHHPREPILPARLAYLDWLMEIERAKEKGEEHEEGEKP